MHALCVVQSWVGLLTFVVTCKQRWCSSLGDVFVWMGGWGVGGGYWRSLLLAIKDDVPRWMIYLFGWGGGGVNDVRWHSTGQVGWMLLADAQKRLLTCKRITIGSAETKVAQWVESLVNTIGKVIWSRYSNRFYEVVGARLRHGRPLLLKVLDRATDATASWWLTVSKEDAQPQSWQHPDLPSSWLTGKLGRLAFLGLFGRKLWTHYMLSAKMSSSTHSNGVTKLIKCFGTTGPWGRNSRTPNAACHSLALE